MIRFRKNSSKTAQPARDYYCMIEEPIPVFVRKLILAYVILYRIITPMLAAAWMGEDVAYPLLRILTLSLMELIIVAPIFVFRRVGYFHPLAFPFFFGLAFDLAFQPMHVLLPFFVAARPIFESSPSYAIVLTYLSREDYSIYNSLLQVATTIFYLFSFIGYKYGGVKKYKEIGSLRPSALVYSAIVYLCISVLCGWLFVASRGGIQGQILSFYEGRYNSLSGLGVFTVPTKVGSVALLLWLAAADKAERTLFFVIMMVALIPIYWLVDGSRSSIALLIVMILIVISLRDSRLPKKLGVVSALFAVIAFGALGMLRQDYNSSSVNFDILNADRFNEWLEASRTETIKRAGEEGDLAAFVVANTKLLLLGKSYLSVIAFPVPRGLWPDKPKNVFTYTNWIAFQGNDDATMAPNTWGIPTNSIAESFWNFGWAGPPIVGGLLGFFLARTQRFFSFNRSNPVVLVFYVEMLVYFNASSRWSMYLIQNLTALAILVIGANLIHLAFSASSERRVSKSQNDA